MKATLSLCNLLSLNIIDFEYSCEDYVISEFSNGTHRSKCKIYYNAQGQPYFKKLGVKYMLDEFMRY